MALHLHVDLRRDRRDLPDLSDRERTLQTGVVHAQRHPWGVADGATLLLVRTQTGVEGTLQSAAEARIYLDRRLRRGLDSHWLGDVQAGAIRVAWLDNGRLRSRAAVALPRALRFPVLHSRTPHHGAGSRLEQLRGDADGLEEEPG